MKINMNYYESDILWSWKAFKPAHKDVFDDLDLAGFAITEKLHGHWYGMAAKVLDQMAATFNPVFSEFIHMNFANTRLDR